MKKPSASVMCPMTFPPLTTWVRLPPLIDLPAARKVIFALVVIGRSPSFLTAAQLTKTSLLGEKQSVK
jgi:hypothetical protein